MEQDNKPHSTATQNQQSKKTRRRFYYHKRHPKQVNIEEQQKLIKQFPFKKISIVIPLLDEEESIFPLYQEIRKVFKNISPDYEIIFVDDGSTDKSLEQIKSIGKNDQKIKYISFRKNYGKSAALQIGFKYVTGDIVVTMDADLQDDPNEIPNLLSKLEEGFDMVSGWKKKRFDPLIKKYSSRFFNFVTRLLTGIKIHDFNCGLKAYRKHVVQNISVYGELHRYMPVLANWKGFTVSEIPVRHHPRRYGKTKFGISRFFKGFVDLITVIFITRYIKRPMHLFGFFGLLSFLIGIAVNAYLSYEWISGKPLYNRPLLFLGMLLIIVGVQFFAVGLLGEIMVHNSQDDKEYVIKEKK